MPVERGKIGARGPVASRLLFGTLTMGPGQRDLPPERALIEGGVHRADRKRLVDKTAAAVILQAYLDANAAKA